MASLPVAVVDATFVENLIVSPTTQVAATGQSTGAMALSFQGSAFGIYANYLNSYDDWVSGGGGQPTVIILVVNKLQSPVSFTPDPDTAAKYPGIFEQGADYIVFDDQHVHYADAGSPYEIPAASADGRTVGLGAYVISTDGDWAPLSGAGHGFTITTAEKRYEGRTLYAGTLFQYSKFSIPDVLLSVSVTDDTSAYASLSDFYDRHCDQNRTNVSKAQLLPGQGKDPASTYRVSAASALINPDWPDYVGDPGSGVWLGQAVFVIE